MDAGIGAGMDRNLPRVRNRVIKVRVRVRGDVQLPSHGHLRR